MVDLDAIRAKRAACADIPWSCPCVSGEQLDALVAEVERLREEAHELRLMAEEAARAENANAEDAKAERAAVVAWLRKSANDTMLDPMTDRQVYARTYSALHRHADMIERGEHRREEER